MKKIIAISLSFFFSFQCLAQNTPQDTIPIAAEIGYANASKATGRYFIFYNTKQGTAGQLTKPIIIVPGYDPEDKITIRNIYNQINVNATAALANDLRAQGYDIVIMDYDFAGDYIQDNAFLLEKLIKIINGQKNGSAQNIVWGFSMGGLVSRYALCHMETHGLNHDTRLLIAYDSPHQGATLPRGLQYLADDLLAATTAVLNSSPAIQSVQFVAAIQVLTQKINDIYLKLVNAPAPQQMLLLHPFYTAFSLRGTLLQEFQSMGNYPKNLRKIAVANGNRSGISQGINAGESLFSINVKKNLYEVELDIWATPGKYVQVYNYPTNADFYNYYRARAGADNAIFTNVNLLYVDKSFSLANGPTAPRLENVPGGTQNIQRQMYDAVSQVDIFKDFVAQPVHDHVAFMPTISALDINTTDYFYNITNDKDILCKTPFDAIFAPMLVNEPHVRVSTVEANWLRDQINPSTWNITNNMSSYNFGANNSSSSSMNFIYKNTVIENTGTLSVNRNVNIDYTHRNTGTNIQQVPTVSNYKLYTPGSCETGVSLTVQNGGDFIIGDAGGSLSGEVYIRANSSLEVNSTGTVTVNSNSKLIIESGGSLKLNNSSHLNIESGAHVIVEQGGRIELNDGSLLTVNDNGLVRVQKGAQFIYSLYSQIELTGINALVDVLAEDVNIDVPQGESFGVNRGTAIRGGTIHIAGGSFVLNENATLASDNCVIKFGEKMNFTYHKDSYINLDGEYGILDIAGSLLIKANADFTFNGYGYIRFTTSTVNSQGYSMNVTAESGSSMTFIGKNQNDRVLEIKQESLYLPVNLVSFTIANGAVAMHPIARLQPLDLGTKITLNNMKMTSLNNQRNNHRGLKLFGSSASINNCVFENGEYGITAYLINSSNPLTITGTTFRRCNTGLYTQDGGVNLTSCSFYENYKSPQSQLDPLHPVYFYGWKTVAMSQTSSVTGCKFGESTDKKNNIGIEYSSNGGTLKVYNCDISFNSNAGLSTINTRTEISCSRINDHPYDGIKISNNSRLVMDNSLNGWGAQVDVSNNQLAIKLDKASALYLDGGNNDLRNKLNTGRSIYGTLIGCYNVTQYLNANNNRWNSTCKITYNDYYITTTPSGSGNCGYVPSPAYRLIDNDPIRQVSHCNTRTIQCDCISNCDVITSRLINCPTCPKINTKDFINERLNDALRIAMSHTTEEGGSDNRKAVDQFHQILKYPLKDRDQSQEYLLAMAYDKMLAALGDAFKNNQITREQNQIELVADVQKVIEIQDEMIQKEAHDYFKRLYITMEKAQTYRLAGRREITLQKLDEILAWALPDDIAYVQEYRCLVSAEHQLATGQISMMEFDNVTTACGKIGSRRITSEENIIPSETVTTFSEIENSGISLHPNPNNGTMQLDYALNEGEQGLFEIFDLTGKRIFKRLLELNSTTSTFSVDGLNPGIYLYKVSSGDKILAKDKLVILR